MRATASPAACSPSPGARGVPWLILPANCRPWKEATRRMSNRFSIAGACLLAFVSWPAPCLAQVDSPRAQLLRCVPKNCGLCLVVNDLRGYAARWEKSPFVKGFKESALGRALVNAPELKGLYDFKEGLKKHFDFD